MGSKSSALRNRKASRRSAAPATRNNELSARGKSLSFHFEQLEARNLLAINILGVPNWVSQGPNPEIQAGSSVPPDSPVAGAIHAIAVNPNNASQIILGSVAGGVWRTTNANPATPGAVTWTPLTDQLASLSIGAVAYDPSDATGNTFFAGTGMWSNSFDTGGSAVGLYRTTDGGATWTLLGNNAAGVNVLAGQRIKSIVKSGQSILVGTVAGVGIGSLTRPADGSRDYATLGGALFLSSDGGATFNQVLPASGFPNGAATSIVVDPNNAQRFFATVAGQGVFRSDDGGANWNAFSTGLTGAAGSSDIELATQNIGGVTTLYAGVSTAGTLNGVFSATNFGGGGNWTALAAPPAGFNAGAGFTENFQILADPTNAGVVYIDSEGGSGIFRYNPAGAGSWVQIDQTGAQGTTPHPDSHDLQFLNATTLLESDDGGIFLLQNPLTAATSDWQSFNGNLSTNEVYSVAYDSTNNVLFAGTQDNGSPNQNSAGSASWTDLTGGDAQFQQADNTSLGGDVFRYSLSNDFGFFSRNRFSNANVYLNAVNHYITNATNAGPIVITSNNHGLLTGDGVFVSGVQGNTAANGGFIVTFINANQFSLNGSNGNGNYIGGGSWQKVSPITNASGAAGNLVLITTSVAHQLTTGAQVGVQQLTGTYAALNGNNYYITVVDGTHFTLDGTSADGSTANGGFYTNSNSVLLKSAIGANNLSGLNAADQAFGTGGSFSMAPFTLNSVDPRLMLLGFNGVYEDADTTAANGFAGDVVTDITANLSGLTGLVSALVYGGRRGGSGFTNVAIVGSTNGEVYFRGEAGAAFTNVSASIGSANPIDSIAVDPQDWRKVYVVTGNQVFSTTDITNLGANPFTVIGGGLSDNLNAITAGLGNMTPELRSVTVVGSTPVVAGLGGVYRMLTPPAGAAAGCTWTEFGNGLPNTAVHDVKYDATDDILIAGTMGRGVWTISNASAAITVGGVLQIVGDGAANNMGLQVDPNNPLRLLASDGIGAPQSFETALFSKVQFQGLAGNDTITIDSNGGVAAGTINFVDFLVEVDGGADGATLNLQDISDLTSDTVTVISNTIGATAGDNYFAPCGRVQYSNLTAIVMDMSGAAGAGDVVNVPSTSAAVTVRGNGGDDQFNIGLGTLASIAGPVTVVGGAGDDSLVVDDHLRTIAVDYHVDPTVIRICATPTDINIANIDGTLETASLRGTAGINPADGNQFDVTPSITTVFNIDGDEPHAPPGDLLSVRFAGTTGRHLTFTNKPTGTGMWTFTNRMNVNFTHIERFNFAPTLVYSADAAKKGKPTVKVVDADDPTNVLATFQAYEATYREGVRVAMGDVTGDGIPEIITVPGHNHAPLVKIWDLLSGTEIVGTSFNAYATSFIQGVNIAVGDVNGDGLNDISVVPSRGNAEVRTFFNQSATTPAKPFSAANYRHLLAFGKSFIGGASIAVGDVLDGAPFNAAAEIIIGSGSGMRDTVNVYSSNQLLSKTTKLNTAATPRQRILPFSATQRGGVFVAVAQLDADAKLEIVVGAAAGGRSQVATFDLNNLPAPAAPTLLNSFATVYTFNGNPSNAPVRVAALAKLDAGGNPVTDIFIAQGPDGFTQKIRHAPPTGPFVDFLIELGDEFRDGFYIASDANAIPPFVC
jgi:hypothetical protein